MEQYDLIVIGSGAGMNVADRARQRGLKVALLENGPLGGTCLNRGCIPSKILIHPADVIRDIEDASRIGVSAKIKDIDFNLVRKRMWELVLGDRKGMERAVESDSGLGFFHLTGHFIGPKTLQVGDKQITAPKIMIAAGVRTKIPSVPGLVESDVLTSENVFNIEKLPTELVVFGGGYKACEFAHFFSAFGTKVTIIGHNPRLLPKEEPEVSDLVKKTMSRYVDVRVNQDVVSVEKGWRRRTIAFRERNTGQTGSVEAEEILVTTGVKSNSDLLRPEASGILMDKNGYIVVNDYLETNVPGIWAFGDIIGRNMYRHTANYESDVAWSNAFEMQKVRLDEHAVPHAVFTYPQVASVGMTEAEARSKGFKVLVGINPYSNCAKGYAMGDEESFVKVVVQAETRKILGASVIGPHAALLLQPLVYLMNAGDQSFIPIAKSQTIHPALSEAVVGAFARLRSHEHEHTH
ncbi:MAG: dihydrolipoyl dehydrogenase [Methanomassiliicoccales archaeon]|nr:dihydrolipoyl dehydrogenase [Methanomassiliicoccales archaeon]